MEPLPLLAEQLENLARHLRERRPAILDAWRSASARDPQLTTASTLSRRQFNDHVPDVLEAFEQLLSARRREEQREAAAAQRDSASEHGLHRWHHGYGQREVMREWSHLQLVLLNEILAWHASQETLHRDVMPAAHRALARLCGDGVVESAAQYANMQQSEAAGRLADLERALADLEALERRRAEAWREAAHDLRGNLGVVTNAATALNMGNLPDSVREQSLTLLQRGIASTHALLTDLMNLARLEAGRERRRLQEFDASRSLIDLCESLRPTATERRLFLRTDGPPSLLVHGDEVKMLRIVRNLLTNAIHYTRSGGVQVAWGEHGSDGERWSVEVRDTGPGLENGPLPPITHALHTSTEDVLRLEEQGEREGDPEAEPSAAGVLPSWSHSRPTSAGEGIGLSIVKRLCELLDASLEVESVPGTGTTFRVIFPQRYRDAAN